MKNSKLTAMLSSAVMAFGILGATVAYSYNGTYYEKYVEGGIWSHGREMYNGNATRLWSNYYHPRDRHLAGVCAVYFIPGEGVCHKNVAEAGDVAKSEKRVSGRGMDALDSFFYKRCHDGGC